MYVAGTASRKRRWLTGMSVVAGTLALLAGCQSSDTSQDETTSAEMMQDEMMSSETMQDDASMTAARMTEAPNYAPDYAPEFTADGQLVLPPDAVWREWPQVGTPLTPNALNDGEAPFPEFHSVYIDPESWRHWRETGEFRDGTVLAKELVSVYGGSEAMPDGSTRQVSGRGYFMGDFIGFEIAYKSAGHFPDAPGNWAYFTFGHHPPPYAAATAPMPLDQCSSCHQASAAEDFVFTQFYPVLRAAKGAER